MERKVTNTQIDDIRYCEDVLDIYFTGSLDSVEDVEEFLNKYLKKAEKTDSDRRESDRIEAECDAFNEYWGSLD